jgi:hypothetical protein
MTSKDDIQGLVSLKFFRPWVYCTFVRVEANGRLILRTAHKDQVTRHPNFSLCTNNHTNKQTNKHEL